MILDNSYFAQNIWLYSVYNLPSAPIEYVRKRGEITMLNRIQGNIKPLNRIRGEIVKLNDIEGEIE